MSPTAAAAAAAGTAPSSVPGIHPVVRLGWKPLCNVVCNGLRGEFLGGHDRDMFMKVTSGHYAGLPLVDASIGGSIMTCSQFERYAGRELSKKWKESIHVVGEGEGSRATLLSWLKRKAEQNFGAAVVGKKIWVLWCADAEYYQGTIVAYNREGGKHTVQYSSRLSEDLHLAVEMISFGVEKPSVPVVAGNAAAVECGPVVVIEGSTASGHQLQTPALSAPAGVETNSIEGVLALHHLPPSAAAGVAAAGNGVNNNNAPPISFNPLWHQGSGISVTSSYGDELRGNAALLAMATGAARNRRGSGGGSGGSKLGSDGDGNISSPRRARRKSLIHIKEDDIAMPPPKRALSAPAAVLLAEAAAAAAAMADEQQQQATAPSPGFGASLPVTPLSFPSSSLMQPLPPPPLGTLTANTISTAASATAPEPLAAAVGWMHDVALCLDKELEDTERATKSIPTTTLSFTSPSGRFQALIGLLRGSPACLFGVFESMVRRYNHFAGIPQLQRQKLVELMLATLIEAAAPRDLFKSVEAAAAAEKLAETTPPPAATAAGIQGQKATSPSPSLLNNAKNNNDFIFS